MQANWKETKICGGRLFTGTIAFSNDSKNLFTFSSGIRVHDTRNGDLVRVLNGGHSDIVSDVVVSRDNAMQLLSSSLDGTVCIWDWTDGSLLRKIELEWPILRMTPHPIQPGILFVLLSGNGADVQLCSVDINTPVPSLITISTLPSATSFALNATGSYAAIIGKNKLQIVDIAQRTCHKYFSVSTLNCVDFDPLDGFVVTGDSIGKIILWKSWKTPSLLSPSQLTIPTVDVRPRQSPTPSIIRPLIHSTTTNTTPSKATPVAITPNKRNRKKKSIKAAKQRKLLVRGGSRSITSQVNISKHLRERLENDFANQMKGLTFTTLHWHAHGVSSLKVFPDGSHIISGGEESVLVYWNLHNNARRFLPRLGAPISSLSLSNDGTLLAAALTNNTIKVISTSESTSKFIIRGLVHMHDTKEVPAGISVDPRKGYIVLNGEPNSLQFYDIRSDSFINQLEVTPPNAVRRDVQTNALLPTANVEHACFTKDGEWLITVDRRKTDWNTEGESSLKFWHWDTNDQDYHLNTRVDSPHENHITSLAVHPTRRLAITTSTDSRFKTWSLVKQTAQKIKSNGENSLPSLTWRCRSVGYYRGLPCSCAAFSPDGSVLALGCGSVLSLWDPFLSSLQFSLSYSPSTASCSEIKRVMFLSGSPLVVAITDSTLLVWNLVSRSLWWSYCAHTLLSASDPNSPLFAIVVSNNNKNKNTSNQRQQQILIVFDGRDPKPKSILRLNCNAIALSFVPPPCYVAAASSAAGCGSGDSNSSNNSSNSSLVYLNENSELIVVDEETSIQKSNEEKEEEELEEMTNNEENITLENVFGGVQSQTTKRIIRTDDDSNNNQGNDTISSIFEGPTHTLPPLNNLLSLLFDKLLPKRTTIGQQQQKQQNGIEMEMEIEQQQQQQQMEIENDGQDEDEIKEKMKEEVDDTTKEWIEDEKATDGESFSFNQAVYLSLFENSIPSPLLPTTTSSTSSIPIKTPAKRRQSVKGIPK